VRLLGSEADAEDVMQETLSGAFFGLKSFAGRASVKTWLTQILMRQVANYCRRRRRGRLRLVQLPRPQTQPAQSRADFRMDLQAAILQLSLEHREVIVLRELGGMSYQEIAQVLDVPAGTVESRLFRARRQLQELLKEYLT
jgi:RNA polymerase sigma-70 factor (ECF subfamily)